MDIELSVRGLLTAFFRQKVRFFLVFCLITLVGGLYVATRAPVYEARSSLLVKFGREALPNLARNESMPQADVSSDRRELMVSLTGIVQSADLLRSAVTDYGVDKLYPEIAAQSATPVLDAVSTLVRNDLHVDLGDKSNLISINVWNRDPAIAAEFAKILIDRFLVRQNEIFNPPRTDFLQQQVAEARAKLEVSQHAFQDFKAEVGISSIDDEMKQLISEKSELSQLAFESVTQAQETLAQLEAKRSELLATMRPSSQVMQRLQANIAEARAQLRSRQDDLNAGSVSSDTSLSTKLASINDRIKYLEVNRGRYQELEQRVTVDEDNYKYYLQRNEEARVNNMLNEQNITRISVVDQPVASPVPVRPRRLVLLASTVIAAVLLGLMLVAYLEIIDDRVRTPHQVAMRLGLPVLASFNAKRGV